jgi:IS30 family transposase
MKCKNFSQLKHFDRDRIDILFNNGHLQKDVARIIQCSESTISRELKRNRRRKRKNKEVILGKYESSVANQKAYVRRKYAK